MNAPTTSAAGRLFDAASALICGLTHTSFEAQGPMQLETLSTQARHPVYLPLGRGDNNVLQSDWEPLLDVIADQGRDPAERAEIFHASVAQLIVQQACRVRQQEDVDQVRWSLGEGFDPSPADVADPTGETQVRSPFARGIAEPHAGYPGAVSPSPRANGTDRSPFSSRSIVYRYIRFYLFE